MSTSVYGPTCALSNTSACSLPPVQFGNGALSPFIPLWFGGEEYNEDPVIDLPSLQEVRLHSLLAPRPVA